MNISSTFSPFARQVMDIPNLTAEEESALWRQYKFANSQEAKEQVKKRIIDAHLKMCVKASSKWSSHSRLSFDDLFGEAAIGLNQAFEKYDPNNKKEARFGTYAQYWIDAGVNAFAMKNMTNAKMGTTRLEKHLFFKYNQFLDRLETEHPDADLDVLHGYMADDWIASLETKPKKATVLKAIKNYLIKRASVASLDAQVSADDTRTKADFLPSRDAETADAYEAQDELQNRRKLLIEALSVLNDRERDILYSRRLAEPIKTLEELSAIYSVSRERIRQIEVRAFEKLQTEIQALTRDNAITADIAQPSARIITNSRATTVTKRRPTNDNGARSHPSNTHKKAVIPKRFSPKRIGAKKLKSVWDAHVTRNGLNKTNKARDWDCFERFTLKRKPITKTELAKEYGVSGTNIGRSIADVEDILSDIFKRRTVDDVVADAEDLLEIWGAPDFLNEVERRFFAQNPFSKQEIAAKAWDYFIKHHVQTPNLLKADIAKEYGLNHATITMALKKAMPVIFVITSNLARERRESRLNEDASVTFNAPPKSSTKLGIISFIF